MEASLTGLRDVHRSYEIADLSAVAFARRGGCEVGRMLGFDDADLGRLALVITEASTNVLKHAHHGELLIRGLAPARAGELVAGVEVLALDQGPGMTDVQRAFRDGVSTSGTSGTGLGAIGRLSDQLSVWSQPGHGTVIRAVVRKGGGPYRPVRAAVAPEIDIGGVCTCKPGEEISDDAWSVETDPLGLTIVLADGLGHGPYAREAAIGALEAARRRPSHPPVALMGEAHASLRATRGAAVAIARIEPGQSRLQFAGTGNIEAVIYGVAPAHRATIGARATGQRVLSPSGDQLLSHVSNRAALPFAGSGWHLVSRHGIVGHTMREAQQVEAQWRSEAMLVLHSDGIGTRWDLAAYPGLLLQPAVLIAAVLYRDFCRRRDDATVVVVKAWSGPQSFSPATPAVSGASQNS